MTKYKYRATINESMDRHSHVSVSFSNPVHKKDIVVIDTVHYMVFGVVHLDGDISLIECDRMNVTVK